MTFEKFKSKFQKKRVIEFENTIIENPIVSISVVTYQHVNYIKQCLDGILMQQTTFPVEILLGEDASTDGTREICLDYAQKHPDKIRLFLHHRENNIAINGNPTGRFNFLYNLYNARGKYIALCEGDDYWTDPLKLQKQVDFLEGNEEYGMCFTRFKTLVHSENTFKDDKNGNYFFNNKSIVDFDFDVFAKGWHVGTQTLLFERKLFKNFNFDKYKYFRDIHLFTELLLKKKGACIKDFCAVYRQHSGGIHSSISSIKAARIGKLCYEELSNKNRSIKPLREKFKSFYKQYIFQLIKNKKHLKALKEVLFFSFEFKDQNFFFTQQKRILKAFLNS